MKIPFGAILLATLAFDAFAATSSTVIDIQLGGGVVQRVLHVRPDAPIATIIAIPGGDGVLGIQADGTMTSSTAQCNPPARTRAAFADRRFALAFVDATSAGVAYSAAAINE
jgi:hypothetical protein